MTDYVLDEGKSYQDGSSPIEDYEAWSTEKLVEYFSNNGLGDYEECLTVHKITGKLAPLLTDQDLKDMGITCVGDRLRFRAHLNALKRKARAETRRRAIWEGKERIYFSDCETLIMTCGGCCPDDPSTYKLTSSHLKVKVVEPARIGPLKLCCCHEYSTNNIDLTHIADVDVVGIPSPCFQRIFCCAPGKDVVEIESKSESETGGKVTMTLKGTDGDEVAELIMNAVEEAQVMERD